MLLFFPHENLARDVRANAYESLLNLAGIAPLIFVSLFSYGSKTTKKENLFRINLESFLLRIISAKKIYGQMFMLF
jgi:hypothetical protein